MQQAATQAALRYREYALRKSNEFIFRDKRLKMVAQSLDPLVSKNRRYQSKNPKLLGKAGPTPEEIERRDTALIIKKTFDLQQ